MLRALRTYPQMLSLYVGFDSGDFFMTIHIAGDKADTLRKALQAPPDAVFANEIVTANATGPPDVRWVFLADDGAVVGRRDQGEAYDPRKRPWFDGGEGNRRRRAQRPLHICIEWRAGIYLEPQL